MADKNDAHRIGQVKMQGVRLSFADIWRPKTFKRSDGTQSTPKYTSNFLFEKAGDTKAVYMGKVMPILKALKAAKMDVLAHKLGEAEALKAKVKPQNYCVRDGDDETYDGYEGCYYVSASNKTQPQIVSKDRRALTEKDGIPYAGCYVNAVITMWCQKPGMGDDGTPRGLGVFASLEAIQFAADGEAFGAKPVDVMEVFEDLSDADDEFEGEEEEEGIL